MVAGKIMQIIYRVVDYSEVLQISRRFKALYNPLSPSDRLVGILVSIVQALMLTVFTSSQANLAVGGSLRAE